MMHRSLVVLALGVVFAGLGLQACVVRARPAVVVAPRPAAVVVARPAPVVVVR